MKNGTVYIIRHAEFEKPVPGAYYGWSDLPLSDAGRRAAMALNERLGGAGVTAAYSSDLIRCRETAALALPGIEVEPRSALREINFGDWEGRRFAEISGLPEYPVFAETGRAPGGESAHELYARVTAAYDAILAANESGNVAITTHAGPARCILAHALGLGEGAVWRFAINMASVCCLNYADGFAYLTL